MSTLNEPSKNKSLFMAVTKTFVMDDKIGEVAGKVYDFLENNGLTTVTKMSKSIDESRSKICMGVGWLAREGKLDFEKDGRAEKIVLK